jgi:hypothetical protein
MAENAFLIKKWVVKRLPSSQIHLPIVTNLLAAPKQHLKLLLLLELIIDVLLVMDLVIFVKFDNVERIQKVTAPQDSSMYPIDDPPHVWPTVTSHRIITAFLFLYRLGSSTLAYLHHFWDGIWAAGAIGRRSRSIETENRYKKENPMATPAMDVLRFQCFGSAHHPP